MPLDPTYMGTIQDVQGPTISVRLDHETPSGLTFIKGFPFRIGQMGSFVRIPMGYLDLYGIISKVGASAVPPRLVEIDPDGVERQGYRWLTVELVGEALRAGEFQRGISNFPTIGDPVHLVTQEGLVKVYGRPSEPPFIRIGHLANAESIPALVDVDRLVTRHCALVGSTGSGKSTTVAGLLNALSDSDGYPSARVLLFDLHGEYAAAFGNHARVLSINPDATQGELPLRIPYWAMSFDELLPLILGEINDKDRAQIVTRITEMKRASLEKVARNGVTQASLTVDSPVPFSIHQFWFDLYCEVNATHTVSSGGNQSRSTWALETDPGGRPLEAGDPLKVLPPRFRGIKSLKNDQDKVYLSGSNLQLGRPLELLASRLRDSRFNFLFRPDPWLPDVDGTPREDLDTFLAGCLGGKTAIRILDLSGVPPMVVNDIIGVLLRILYDALFWARNLSEGSRERPLFVVLEEAHLYLGSDHATRRAVASVQRMVKEGRKYGVGTMIVSQRPSEIDPTILSQCGTLLAMRLTNAEDRSRVVSVAADNLTGLLSMLPILRTGESIVVGEAVQLPTRAFIDAPPSDRRPSSEDPLVYSPDIPGGWNTRSGGPENYMDVVQVWRQQSPRSPRLVHEKERM